jgi:hypothetical protein
MKMTTPKHRQEESAKQQAGGSEAQVRTGSSKRKCRESQKKVQYRWKNSIGVACVDQAAGKEKNVFLNTNVLVLVQGFRHRLG